MSKFLAINLKTAAVSTSCICPLDIVRKLCLSKPLLLRFCDQKCFEFQITRNEKLNVGYCLLGVCVKILSFARLDIWS